MQKHNYTLTVKGKNKNYTTFSFGSHYSIELAKLLLPMFTESATDILHITNTGGVWVRYEIPTNANLYSKCIDLCKQAETEKEGKYDKKINIIASLKCVSNYLHTKIKNHQALDNVTLMLNQMDRYNFTSNHLIT